jgi:PAS domain S-box-containing protein
VLAPQGPGIGRQKYTIVPELESSFLGLASGPVLPWQRPKPRGRFLAVLWFLWCVIGTPHESRALDPRKALTQYAVEYWQADKGLPHSAIHAIVQTKDGYLWLGTEAGLARFDGFSFTVFDRLNTPEIGNNFIYRLAVTPDGSLWAGTRGGGLAQYLNGRFTNYSKASGLADDHVYSMTASRDGGLWVGTRSGGISHIKGAKITNLTTNEGLSENYILSLFEDREGSIWAGTYQGKVDRIKSGKVAASYDVALQFRAFAEDKDGNLLAGGEYTGLYRFRTDHFERILSDHDVNGAILAMLPDGYGNIWLGCQSGSIGSLGRYGNGRRLEVMTSQTGLSTDDISSICQDRDGGLWVGTLTGGLNHLKDGTFATIGAKEGLSYDDVLCVREGKNNSLWIGTRSGLNRMMDGKFTAYGVDGGQSANGITSVLQASDESVWFGNVSGGLHHLKGEVLTYYSEQNGLCNQDVWAVNEARDGSIWVGARAGLFQLKEERVVRKYTKADGLADMQIRTIIEDRSGAVWIGTQGSGLNRLKDGVFEHFSTKQGLSDNSVRCLMEDREGALWIGTRDGGVNRLKDGKFTVFNTRNGLPHDTIFSILDDERGNLWFGAAKGIFRVSRRDLEQAAANPGKSIHPLVFGEADGMRSSECSGGYMTAACRMPDGRLFFSTKKGVVWVHPDTILPHPGPPPVILEGIRADRQPIDLNGQRALPPGDGDFEFNYSALALRNPNKIRFRYQLAGFDKGWVEAGSRRVAYYTNLRPGKYQFKVTASNEDGEWNNRIESFAFELLPHFYQTFWFAGLCVLSVALLGFGGHRVRVRQVRLKGLELEALVKDRTRELREEISERRRGEEALRESEKRFRTLASHAPVGIFMTDTMGDYVFVNERWCEMGGLNPEEAKGRGWSRALHPEDQQRATDSWYRSIRTGEAYATEYRFQNRQGLVISLTASAVTLHNHKGEIAGFLGTVTDVTDLKRAEESLLHQQALLTNVIAHIPCGVFWKDTASVYLGCNHTFAKTVGLSLPADVVGKTDHELPCSKDEADWFLKCDQQVMRGNKPMLNVEEPLRLADGKHSVVLTSKVPLHDLDGRVTGILGIFTDIGDQKRFQEALRGLPQHIIDAQEAERRRVARELHDGVIQLLSTAKFRMQSVAGKAATTALGNPLATPDTLLEKAIQEIRRISRNLRPSELDDLGLVPAVRSICEEFQARTAMEIELDCKSPPERLTPEQDLALYRIVQESLTNIEKHSGATKVHLRLHIKPDVIELTLRDNGKGFDPAQGSIHYGRETCMGLVDMKERAAFVAGTLMIQSKPGEGTEIVALIPMRRSGEQERK